MTDERYAIALDITLSTDGKKYTVYWIQESKDIVTFKDAFSAKVALAQVEMESGELAFLTNMRVVQVDSSARFVTFPDEVQVPLLSTGKKVVGTENMEYDAMFFYVKIMANGKLLKKVEEIGKTKGAKFVLQLTE